MEKNEHSTPDYENHDSEPHIPHFQTDISSRSDQLRYAALHCVIILYVLRKMKLFGDDPLARKAKKRLDEYFDGRNPLTHKEFYERYFKSDEFSENVVTKVLKIFEDQLEYDFSRLEETDDFTEELSAIWNIDSMADVEIVIALEEEFEIEFTKKEALQMKTIRKIVEIIHRPTKVEQVDGHQQI